MLNLAGEPGTDNCFCEAWSGKFWEPLLSTEACDAGVIQKGKWSHIALIACETTPPGLTLFVNGKRQLTAPCGFDFVSQHMGIGALLPGEESGIGLTSMANNGNKWVNKPGKPFKGKVCCVEFCQSMLLSEDQVAELAAKRDQPEERTVDPIQDAEQEKSK